MANILVVDDDHVILLSVQAMLVKAGHTVVLAHDGYEAIDMASNELFDLIVSDANMPGGISGFNLVATLRKTERYRIAPIIFLTGRREKKDVDRALESGVDDYIVKPIDFDILLAKVESLLQSPSSIYAFSGSQVKVEANWQVHFEILSLSEQGLSVRSPTPLIVNKKIRIESDVFDQIGIAPSTLRVASSLPADKDQKSFVVQLHFIGLKESELKKIRMWVASQSKNRRWGAA